jgi:ribosomal peptide maturation radical SAM protein 1
MNRTFQVPSRVLLIVPPFGPLTMPSLGLHTLQAVARCRGYDVSVLYANLDFCKRIGRETYEEVRTAAHQLYVGGNIFARHAFELDRAEPSSGNGNDDFVKRLALWNVEVKVEGFLYDLVEVVRQGSFQVVGCTTTFDQTHAALAILRAIKRNLPETLTLIGGANCESEMGRALADVAPMVDHVFCGEAEQSFTEFIGKLQSGHADIPRIIEGAESVDLNDIPCPNFEEYFYQLDQLLPEINRNELWVTYETSRGCWWGEKHHCSFCGLNGGKIAFRVKSAEKVESDLLSLVSNRYTKKICMTDNIMPYSYHRTLIPKLGSWASTPEIFYEQKSSLSLEKMAGLSRAGIRILQIGVETLSTRLLRSMDKGSSASQNILALRSAWMCGVKVVWNFLFGIPGESERDYEEMLDVLPWVVHLQPPQDICKISIDRFSPYFFQSKRFGITSVRPHPGYTDIFPKTAKLNELAYHFVGEYESCADLRSRVVDQFNEELRVWCGLWQREPGLQPRLSVLSSAEDGIWLIDTRRKNDHRCFPISSAQAKVALFGDAGCSGDLTQWAISNRICLRIDDRTVPLAVTDLRTMNEMGAERPGVALSSKA